MFTSPSGAILSPDHDEDGFYDDMVECSWIIKASDKQVINLEFAYLRLEDRAYDANDELICSYDYVMVIKIVNEPVHEIFNNEVCATSKASDQPAHARSLIRAFASRLSII